MQAVQDGTPAALFVDSPGGSGKTFLYRALLARIRADGHIALAVASSRIAALLLSGGHTAHSRFKIPIDVNKDSTCYVSHRSDLAQLLKRTRLIVWDEAPMMHRFAFEAVDRTLKDLMKAVDSVLESQPFGGKVIVFGGDFRQILPVVPRSGCEATVEAYFSRSYLWRYVHVMSLNTNMCLLTNANASDHAVQQDFARWLLQLDDSYLQIVD